MAEFSGSGTEAVNQISNQLTSRRDRPRKRDWRSQSSTNVEEFQGSTVLLMMVINCDARIQN